MTGAPTTVTRAPTDVYRDAMSRLAAGVAVITTVDADGQPHGLTVSSLASHSIDPPTVLVSIHLDSRTFAALAETGSFVAHLLTGTQRDIAEVFATPRSTHRFDAVRWHREDRLPVLDHALATLRCDVASCYPHGDHAVVLGTVRDITIDGGDPLIYVDRDYASPDRPIGSRPAT